MHDIKKDLKDFIIDLTFSNEDDVTLHMI